MMKQEMMMLKEMQKMTAKQLDLVRSMTIAAYADGKMTARERDQVFETMKRVLVDRIHEKRGHKIAERPFKHSKAA
jgi:uncharacterized membrane protein YebE (DUF533 family)